MQKSNSTQKENRKDAFYCILLFIFVIGIFLVFFTPEIFPKKTTIPEESVSEEKEATVTKKLELTAYGTYNMPGFSEEFFIYRFSAPNDNIVVYEFNNIYLIGEDSGKNGTSYSCKVMYDSQLVALSDKYFLFITNDGMIALAFEENKNAKVGESCYIKCPFDDLSEEEKAAFIYPVSYEKVQNPAK